MPTKKKVKYWSVWDTEYNLWVYTKNICRSFGEQPDLFIVNNTIGVWLSEERIRRSIFFQGANKHWGWEIREFTPLDALKERMRNCRSA